MTEMITKIMKKLGRVCLRLRHRLDWSRAQLSGAASIGLKTVQRFENGDGYNIQLRSLLAIFDALIEELEFKQEQFNFAHEAQLILALRLLLGREDDTDE